MRAPTDNVRRRFSQSTPEISNFARMLRSIHIGSTGLRLADLLGSGA